MGLVTLIALIKRSNWIKKLITTMTTCHKNKTLKLMNPEIPLVNVMMPIRIHSFIRIIQS